MLRALSAAMLASMLACAGSHCGADPPTPVVERYAVTADSVRLYYRVAGTGPETVLAPFALFHESALDRLAHGGRRIVTYDPRGRGRSDSVPPEKVSLDLLQLDLETVRQAVGADRVALIAGPVAAWRCWSMRCATPSG